MPKGQRDAEAPVPAGSGGAGLRAGIGGEGAGAPPNRRGISAKERSWERPCSGWMKLASIFGQSQGEQLHLNARPCGQQASGQGHPLSTSCPGREREEALILVGSGTSYPNHQTMAHPQGPEVSRGSNSDPSLTFILAWMDR